MSVQCRVCGRGPGEGVILLRQNALEWACVAHNRAAQPAEVMETVAVLSELLAA